MWGRQHFGVAIQNDVYDNQPVRSPGLLLINLSFHAVLITRNVRGENISYGDTEDSDSSAVNFCSQ